MAAPLPIILSASREVVKSPVEFKIEKFYALSTNLTYKEKCKGGEVYQLLEELFGKGYAINENQFITDWGLGYQSWPQLIAKEGAGIRLEGGAFNANSRNVNEMTLSDYLMSINPDKANSLAARTIGAAKPITSIHKSSSASVYFSGPMLGSATVKPYVYSSFSSSGAPLLLSVPQASSSAPAQSKRVDSPFQWVSSSKPGFPKPLSTALLESSLSPDKDIANEDCIEVQKAIDLFCGCIYYQTFDGKEAIVKKDKVIACQPGVQFYSPYKDLSGCYRCDDGSMCGDLIRNVKLKILLDSREAILRIIKRLKGIPLVNEPASFRK